MGKAVLQYSHCTCNTARARRSKRRRGALRACRQTLGGLGAGRWVDWALGGLSAGRRRARQASGSRRRRAGRAAGACGALGRQGRAGHVAWALGARPVRTWACQQGQLGARAPGLVFRPGFRLGDVFESPFEPGS